MKSYPITPCPKPRQTNRDRRGDKRPVVARWHAFRDEIQLYKVDLPLGARVAFILPMPASWSKKKRNAMWGARHEQTPDLDNLLGGLLDAVYPDMDSHFWHIGPCGKFWGEEGCIIIESEDEWKGAIFREWQERQANSEIERLARETGWDFESVCRKRSDGE